MDDQSPGEDSSSQEGKGNEKRTLDVHFDRSPSYQLHHVDGVHGGIAPNGEHLVFDLYVERTPNPKLIRHEVEVEDQADLPDGAVSLGDEISRGGREGVLRESECGVVMSWGAVLRLHNWLGEKIEEAKDAGILEKDEPQNADD